MIVKMYSYTQFPIEMRSDFELPSWPYNEKYFHLFKSYMHSLGVFRYEDSVEEDGGRNVFYPINFPTEDIDYPFKAYYNMVAISDSELKVIDWPADDPDGAALLKQIDEDPVFKDRKAWMMWNVPVMVSDWNGSMIKREFIHQEMRSLCQTQTCYQQGKNFPRLRTRSQE